MIASQSSGITLQRVAQLADQQQQQGNSERKNVATSSRRCRQLLGRRPLGDPPQRPPVWVHQVMGHDLRAPVGMHG
jgi:hypothetical protein